MIAADLLLPAENWAGLVADATAVLTSAPTGPPADRLLAALSDLAAECDRAPADDLPDAARPAGGRYEKIAVIGRGGRGVVWRARDHRTGRDVALKEPRPDRPGDGAAELVAAAAVLVRLRHPNVVPLYDLDPDPADGSLPFYTMPLLAGPTLRAAAAAFHPDRAVGGADAVRFRRLVAAVHEACQAVAHAHARGVLHLDLKGDNVQLGDGGEAVVLDWGAAEGRTGGGTGTPGYAAPEQVAPAQSVGPATDVFGLGAVLYEVLTGRPAFSGEDTADVVRRTRAAAPSPLRTFWPAVPRALEAVCLRAMARRPEARYPSADAVRADVERWLAGEPVSVYRETAWDRAGRWVRRHGRAARGIAAGVVLAVAGLGVGLAEAERARGAADQARAAADDHRRAAEAALAAETDSFRLALEAGAECVAAVGDTQLSQVDGTQALRLRLLERGVAYYQTLLRRHADDPAVRLAVAEIWARLGFVQRDVGRQEDAIRSYRAAIPALEPLAAGPAPDGRARDLLTEVRCSLGFSLALTGRRGEAAVVLDEAEAAVRRMGPADPVGRLYLLVLVHDARGFAAPTPAAAEAAFAAAADFAGQAAAARPSDRGFRYMRALDRLQVAIRQRDLGRPADARATLVLARTEFDALGREAGWPTDVRQRAAACVNMDGVIAVAEGRPAAAVPLFAEAVAHRRELAARNPASLPLRGELATSLANLGRALRMAGRPADAAGPAREGCEWAVVCAGPTRGSCSPGRRPPGSGSAPPRSRRTSAAGTGRSPT